jgi:hypothetical protein
MSVELDWLPEDDEQLPDIESTLVCRADRLLAEFELATRRGERDACPELELRIDRLEARLIALADRDHGDDVDEAEWPTVSIDDDELADDDDDFRLAVLDDDPQLGALLLVVGRDRITRECLVRRPWTLVDLEVLAQARQCWQLWLHPRWGDLPADLDLRRGERLAYPCWQTRPSKVAIALPALDKRMGPWAQASDGLTLARALGLYRRVLGRRFRRGPGQVGMELLEETLRGSGRYLAATLPVVDGLRHAEADFSWIRPLTDAERRREWIHRYDKHSAYLGSISSLRLGLGSPTRVQNIDFDRRLPGYWLVDVEWRGNPLLPDPTRARWLDPEAPAMGPRWLTTPSLEVAQQYGARVHVHEAYVWEQSGRPLEPFYRRLRDARAQLNRSKQDPAAALALEALKQIYQVGLGGWLDARWKRKPDADGHTHPLFRPDWRHSIMAQSRANLWRQLPRLEAAGLAPAAVRTDALYIASDEPDPMRAIGDLLPIGDDLRSFSWEGSCRLAEVLEHFEGHRALGRLQAAFTKPDESI